jgi:hypothetical protein
MMKIGRWRVGGAKVECGETPVTTPVEVDPYVAAWEGLSALEDSWAHGTRLTNASDGLYTREYAVELRPGQRVAMLRRHRAQIACVLGEPVERVLVGESRARRDLLRGRLTIVKVDPVADVRYVSAAPTTVDNVIRGLGRLVDGSGEASVKMWDSDGMVPTVLTGGCGTGKTEAVKLLACGALAGGLMNLVYAEPRPYVLDPVARHARVAIIGRENVLRLPDLMRALINGRAKVLLEQGVEALPPSAFRPGWMVLHEGYPTVPQDDHVTAAWWEIVSVGSRLGLWPVAVTQSSFAREWRAGHGRQVIAFGGHNDRGDLVDGLPCEPKTLPRDDCGRFVPGMAVHSGLDTPVRWDYLPSATGAQWIVERGEPAPPLTDEAGFARFSNAPDVDPAEVEVLERFLGKAVHGRWQVGGPDATHEFKL